jgi:glycosyltransferase involved in cell wall biosynthesis
MVDSEFVKKEVIEELQISPDKVDVIYPGVDGRFCPKPPAEVLAFKKAAGLPEHYILYVGAIEPRKNLPFLLRAFHRAGAFLPPDLVLVLAGPLGWRHEEVIQMRERLGLKSRVFLPDYIPEEKLPLLYSGAELFVYPSLYEGFGLPWRRWLVEFRWLLPGQGLCLRLLAMQASSSALPMRSGGLMRCRRLWGLKG